MVNSVDKSKEAYTIILMFLNYIDRSAGVHKKGFGNEYLQRLSFTTLKRIYRLYGKVNKKGKLDIECPFSRYLHYEGHNNNNEFSEQINKKFVINYLSTSVYISDTKLITENCRLHPDDSKFLNKYSITLDKVGDNIRRNKSFRDAFLSHILETDHLTTSKLTNDDLKDIANLQRKLISESSASKSKKQSNTPSSASTSAKKHSISRSEAEYLDYLKSCPNDKNKVYFKVGDHYYMFVASLVKGAGVIIIYDQKQHYGWLDVLDKCVKKVPVLVQPNAKTLIKSAISLIHLPVFFYDGKNAVFYNGSFTLPTRPKEDMMNVLKAEANLKVALDIYKHSKYV